MKMFNLVISGMTFDLGRVFKHSNAMGCHFMHTPILTGHYVDVVKAHGTKRLISLYHAT